MAEYFGRGMFRQDIDFESLEPVSEKPTTKAAVSRFPKEKSVSPVPQRRPQSTVTTSTPAASKAKSSQNESLNPFGTPEESPVKELPSQEHVQGTGNPFGDDDYDDDMNPFAE